MSNAIWINLPVYPAIRRTAASDTLSLDVDAGSTEGPDAVNVVFTITSPDGKILTRTVTQRQFRRPDFSSLPSRIPGGGSGLSKANVFGTTLTMSEIAPGRAKIDATVNFPGSQQILPSIYVLNDRDGIDRRGSSKTIYLNGTSGSDSNGGSFESPVKSINKAIELARTAGNCGGAKIIAAGNVVGCGPAFANWHSGDQWLTIEFAENSTWKRDPGGQNYINCAGFGGEYRANIRIVSKNLLGKGMVFFGEGFPTSNVVFTVWYEHPKWSSEFYDPAVPWSVDHLRDFGEFAVIQGTSTVIQQSKVFLTGLHCTGSAYGPASISRIYDFVIENYIGIAFQPEGAQNNDVVMNGIIQHQRSRSIDVKGYLSCRGGTALQVSEPSAGVLRITATAPVVFSDSFDNPTSTPVDIADQVAEIVGSDFWWLNLESFGSHTGRHQVLAVGHSSGNPYIDLDYAGAITPGTAPSTARLRTIRNNGSPYDPHPDLNQMLGDRRKPFYKNIAAFDINDSQGWFLSGTLEDGVFVNIHDDGKRNPFGGTGMYFKNCLFHNITFTGSWDFNAEDTQSSGNILRDSVLRAISGLPSGAFATIDRLHLIEGTLPAGATNSTTGPFFKTGILPLREKFNLGILTECPDEWVWPGASQNSPDTQGVYANIYNRNWGDTSPIFAATSAATSSLAASMGVMRVLAATVACSSTVTASLVVTRGLTAISFSISSVAASLLVGTPAVLSATISSTSSISASLVVTRALSATLSSASSLTATLQGTVPLAATVSASSSLSATLTVQPIPPTLVPVSATAEPSRTDMKQRIYNTLLAVVSAGPFHVCSINKKTGQMTIDLTKPVEPRRVVVKEIRSSYRLAKYNKRSYGVQELDAWQWIAEVEFPHVEVSCESFEETVTASGITIPPVLGLDTSNQRTLLAKLVGCEYTHPPEQSPNVGTMAEFSFEIDARLLRK